MEGLRRLSPRVNERLGDAARPGKTRRITLNAQGGGGPRYCVRCQAPPRQVAVIALHAHGPYLQT